MRIQLGDFSPGDPVDWRWPSGNVFRFDPVWEGSVIVDGLETHIRHGLGTLDRYGSARTHAVTWVNGQVSVEGIAADDYNYSRSLLSLLKRPDGKHARRDEDVPPGYDDFIIVSHRHEIDAPRSPKALAVKIVADDLSHWAIHAVIRAASFGRFGTSRPSRGRAHERKPVPPVPIPKAAPLNEQAVVDALLAYGQAVRPAHPTGPPSFTPDPEANELVLRDPFAFLLGVIFDQGVSAERAWRAPFELRRRLGHFELARIAAEANAVAAAVKQPPALHRFVSKVPEWIIDAAKRVLQEYDGDASRIWSDAPTARVLRERLDAFHGVGQKKAAMAVEILERDLGVKIQALEGSDVAYDIHVRRVFLRTGLADRDELDHIVQVARRLNPARPGALDEGAWRIGRGWCHAGTPNCVACPITKVCPRLVYRAADVRGA